MDCVKVLRKMKRMACERLKRDQQRACETAQETVSDVAVRGDRRKHLQENLDRAAEAADNGTR